MTVHSPLLNSSERRTRTTRQGAILVPNSRLARGNGLYSDLLWSWQKPASSLICCNLDVLLCLHDGVGFLDRCLTSAGFVPRLCNPLTTTTPTASRTTMKCCAPSPSSVSVTAILPLLLFPLLPLLLLLPLKKEREWHSVLNQVMPWVIRSCVVFKERKRMTCRVEPGDTMGDKKLCGV